MIPAHTVQTYTLAHVTHEHSRIAVNRNQSIERMLYLDGHRISSCNKKWNINKKVNSPKNQKALNTQPKHHTVGVYVIGVFAKQIVANPVFHSLYSLYRYSSRDSLVVNTVQMFFQQAEAGSLRTI